MANGESDELGEDRKVAFPSDYVSLPTQRGQRDGNLKCRRLQ
jgi:hypothetical protein